MPTVYDDSCCKAGLNAREVLKVARGISKYAKMAEIMGITIFGGSGSGTLRIHENTEPGSRPLILAEISGGYFDGGCGATQEDEDGFLRGE